jgi:nitrite reductase/ring-hydroxylating ferredoxin subunit
MDPQISQEEKIKRGADDSGQYFRYMMEFVGFTPEDGAAIKGSWLIIEKHLPSIVADFYSHLLRYPPTRKYFLDKDGSLDQDYIQKRMAHLTNFWRRTGAGVFDDDYARYIDYVGRAHTCRGADPSIYIAERYVIGQVGFIQHAITNALAKELHEYDEDLEHRAVRAWNMLMMVILEMLSRAYGKEHEVDYYDGLIAVDDVAVQQLAVDTYEIGLGLVRPRKSIEVRVGRADEIPEGERKLIQIDDRSIGVFHHKGKWVALLNHCLHRGGPVATGRLEGDVLTCPWHGFQYDVNNGQLLVDPGVKLEMFPVDVRDGEVYLSVPEPAPVTADILRSQAPDQTPAPASRAEVPVSQPPRLKDNEFYARELAPGSARLVYVNGQAVAVYNVGGEFYATQNECTHAGGPLSQGKLQGVQIECPWHGSCFDVSNGKVLCGPANRPVKTFMVTLDGDIVRVNN